jgi:hypothetical protein
MVVYTCHPSYLESINRRIKVQASQGKNPRPKRARGAIQVVEHPPSKCKTLSSISSNTKKKKRKEERKSEKTRNTWDHFPAT